MSKTKRLCSVCSQPLLPKQGVLYSGDRPCQHWPIDECVKAFHAEITRLTAELAVAKLRLAGCRCEQPLIGDRGGVVRCRLCGVEVSK